MSLALPPPHHGCTRPLWELDCVVWPYVLENRCAVWQVKQRLATCNRTRGTTTVLVVLWIGCCCCCCCKAYYSWQNIGRRCRHWNRGGAGGDKDSAATRGDPNEAGWRKRGVKPCDSERGHLLGEHPTYSCGAVHNTLAEWNCEHFHVLLYHSTAVLYTIR